MGTSNVAYPTRPVLEASAKVERIRLLLVDGHALFRESLGRLLSAETGFEVVAECSDFAAALEALGRLPVDVMLVDFELGQAQGNRFLSAARSRYRGKTVILTAKTSAAESSLALQFGAHGIFLKQNSPSSLVKVIRQVAAGEICVDRTVIQQLAGGVNSRAERGPRAEFTEREHQVLRSVIDGLTNRAIAEQIGVSEGAVKATLQRLFRKTRVRTRSQLVRVALEVPFRTLRKPSPALPGAHRP